LLLKREEKKSVRRKGKTYGGGERRGKKDGVFALTTASGKKKERVGKWASAPSTKRKKNWAPTVNRGGGRRKAQVFCARPEAGDRGSPKEEKREIGNLHPIFPEKRKKGGRTSLLLSFRQTLKRPPVREKGKKKVRTPPCTAAGREKKKKKTPALTIPRRYGERVKERVIEMLHPPLEKGRRSARMFREIKRPRIQWSEKKRKEKRGPLDLLKKKGVTLPAGKEDGAGKKEKKPPLTVPRKEEKRKGGNIPSPRRETERRKKEVSAS